MAELALIDIRARISGVEVVMPIFGEIVAPGLAITPAIDGTGLYAGGWTLTHVASGWQLSRRESMCLGCCRDLVARVAPVADWTQPVRDLLGLAEVVTAVEQFWAASDTCALWRTAVSR
jgi:hypothetical protein